MINLKKTFLIIAMGLCSIYGAEITIDEQIKTILQASPQDRVRLMNQLKIQLASMNEQQYEEAIQALQSKMGGSVNKSVGQCGQQGANMGYLQMQQTRSSRQIEMMKQHQTISPNTQMPHSGGR